MISQNPTTANSSSIVKAKGKIKVLDSMNIELNGKILTKQDNNLGLTTWCVFQCRVFAEELQF